MKEDGQGAAAAAAAALALVGILFFVSVSAEAPLSCRDKHRLKKPLVSSSSPLPYETRTDWRPTAAARTTTVRPSVYHTALYAVF